jgi:hypothetical protein
MRDRAPDDAGGWRHARVTVGLVFVVGLLDGLVVATGTANVELIAAVGLGVAVYALIDWFRPKRSS